MRARLAPEEGFGVVELVVVAAILGVVVASVGSLLMSVQRNEVVQQGRIRNQEDVRLLMVQIAKEIRAANPPLVLGDTTQYANRMEVALGPTGGAKTYVRWDLAGGVLTRSVIAGPQGAVTSTTARLTGVTSVPLFRYFDQAGLEIVAPNPVDDFVNCAVRVQVRLRAAPDPAAPAFEQIQDVEVRNRVPGAIEGC